MSRPETAEPSVIVPPSLEEVRERLAPFCQRHPIQKLEVFGSVSRGEQEAGSDVDLMVTFTPGVKLGCYDFLEMQAEIERLLGCPTDFVEREAVESHRNEIRRRHMLRGVKVIYVKA